MDFALVIAVGTLCICCFYLGAKLGQTVSKGEEIKLPTVNPLELYREHEQKKEAKAEQERIDVIMRNVEAYDGTGNNQEDVPGR